MRRRTVALVMAGFIAGATISVRIAGPAWAQAPVSLGVAGTYGVLAGQAVTDVPPPVGPSVIARDLGVWPGTSVTGAPVVGGATHVGDTQAMQAQAALTTAYNFAASRPTTATVSADLGGQTLVAGAYRSPATMSLTGTLTLDGQNDPNSVFIFQAGSDLIAATDSRVTLIRGAQPCNVFWQVSSSATLNTRSRFIGSILALQSATLGEGAFVAGRVLARNGAVTLIHNTIVESFCATSIGPPTLSKAFGDATIPVGGTTSLSFTIRNPNPNTGLTGVGFTDGLPAGLVVSSPSGLTGSCGGGTITAVGSGVSLAGATLPEAGSCTFSVNVTAATSGTKVNTSGPVEATESGPGAPASASIAVGAAAIAPPAIAKAFGGANIPVGGRTSLSFTIANPNAGTALTGVTVTDALPAGLVVANPNGVTGSCGGGTITATAGGGSVSLAGAILPAGGSCTFSINVVGTTSGTKVNTSGPVDSTESGPGATASASITVVPALAPAATKTFAQSTIAVNGTTSLRFTVDNPNTALTLTGINFVDNLPPGLLVATPNGLTGSCGGGTITATAGGGSVSLAGATLPAGGGCTFSINVVGTTSGTKVNSSGPVDSTESIPGHPASAVITISSAGPPLIAKAFADTSIVVEGTTLLGFTLTNPNNGTALTGVSFVDNLPTGLIVATSAAAVTNCANGEIIASPGSSSIVLFGATMPARSSCTVTVNVTGTSIGTKVNTTVTVTSVQSGPGPVATARVIVRAAPFLPVTGGRSAVYPTVALVMIGFGVVLVAVSRRPFRRRSDIG
jgi:hypothetical protein